jgi:DNA helicase-2/ATP-dependent DNA helicase PcrA
VRVSTLHSLALSILKTAGLLGLYPADPVVMDDWELRNIFDAEFAKSAGFPPTRCEEIRREHEAFWSTGQWGPPNYIPPNPPIQQSERSRFSAFHVPRTQVYSCVLPGEIVRGCVRHTAAGSLNPVSKLQIKHLIVDEFQDLNPCDLDFVDCLMQGGVITFVAGDDDQSVYSFRFASPQGIQAFTSKYAQAGNHALSDCFRSTPAVLRAATSVINAHPIPNRIPKTVRSLYLGASPPLQGIVLRWRFRTGAEENRSVAESCRDLVGAGIPPREILILVSNRRVLESGLASALEVAGVPYARPRADVYTDLDEGRFVLACLRIVCSRDDYVAHRLILGLKPHVGTATCTKIADAVVQNNLSFRDLFWHPLPSGVFHGRELTALNSARGVVAQLSQWKPVDTLGQRDADMCALAAGVLGAAAAQAWLCNTGHLPRDMSLEEVRDYLWADTDEQEEKILDEVYERLGKERPSGSGLPARVRIMTMHSAKGLEAHVVFVPGLEAEILPGPKRRPYPGLVLEAARLLYVSVARARAACILSYADKRMMYGKFAQQTPSPFVPSLGGAFVFRQQGGLSWQEVQGIVRTCTLL